MYRYTCAFYAYIYLYKCTCSVRTPETYSYVRAHQACCSVRTHSRAATGLAASVIKSAMRVQKDMNNMDDMNEMKIYIYICT